MSGPFILGVDFDGTIADHRFPLIGPAAPDAFYWLMCFQEAGARIILWTMRSDGPPRDGIYANVLTEAVKFCADRGLTFWAVNENPEQKEWTSSNKVYFHALVDDNAIGCPLLCSHPGYERPVVDWDAVGPLVMDRIRKHNLEAA